MGGTLIGNMPRVWWKREGFGIALNNENVFEWKCFVFFSFLIFFCLINFTDFFTMHLGLWPGQNPRLKQLTNVPRDLKPVHLLIRPRSAWALYFHLKY